MTTTRPPRASPGGTDALVGDLQRRLREAGLPVGSASRARPPARPRRGRRGRPGPHAPRRRRRRARARGAGLGRPAGAQRRAAFERSGWRYLRVAAMDLFCDPEREVERITSAWRAAGGRPAPPAQAGPHGDPPRPRTRTPWPDVTPRAPGQRLRRARARRRRPLGPLRRRGAGRPRSSRPSCATACRSPGTASAGRRRARGRLRAASSGPATLVP